MNLRRLLFITLACTLGCASNNYCMEKKASLSDLLAIKPDNASSSLGELIKSPRRKTSFFGEVHVPTNPRPFRNKNSRSRSKRNKSKPPKQTDIVTHKQLNLTKTLEQVSFLRFLEKQKTIFTGNNKDNTHKLAKQRKSKNWYCLASSVRSERILKTLPYNFAERNFNWEAVNY